jgi:hypothetical protein
MRTATSRPEAARVLREIVPAELNRMLGLPRHRDLQDGLAQRAVWARQWYGRHGHPYIRLQRHAIAALGSRGVLLEGGRHLPGRALADHLRRYTAHALVGIAVSAGAEVDQASAEAWGDSRPDEGFFLARLGAAVAEQLLDSAIGELCRRSEPEGETLTPHLSPGCGGWELDHQRALWKAVFPEAEGPPMRLLESGGLLPNNAMLAVAGITRQVVRASPRDACRSCRLPRCGFRRAPYGARP